MVSGRVTARSHPPSGTKHHVNSAGTNIYSSRPIAHRAPSLEPSQLLLSTSTCLSNWCLELKMCPVALCPFLSHACSARCPPILAPSFTSLLFISHVCLVSQPICRLCGQNISPPATPNINMETCPPSYFTSITGAIAQLNLPTSSLILSSLSLTKLPV